MVVKNLHFFNKKGYDYNFEYDETDGRWKGSIFMPKTSIGLYSSAQIFILEQVGNKFYFPVADEVNKEIVCYWDPSNNFVDEFFMYNFDESYIMKETSALEYTQEDGPRLNPVLINRFDNYYTDLSYDYDSSAMPLYIAFSADEKYNGTTYERTLFMRSGVKTIAEIKIYAETVEEDERLKVWTKNLGYNLTPEDAIIFKESDIKEYKPNYILLNEKRKELLMEGSNIYPYVGSYRALINAIKFFGYDNLSIIEYWRNVDPTNADLFGKEFHSSKYSLNKSEVLTVNSQNITLPNANYKKTNKISLAYTINHTTGKFDDWELPLVEEDFTYTIEEAMIKLFALRRKLDKEFMPGSTRLNDIIGEANYFGLNIIQNNPTQSSTTFIKEGIRTSFKAFPSDILTITDDRGFESYVCTDEDSDSDSEEAEQSTDQVDVIEDLYDTTIEDVEDKIVGPADLTADYTPSELADLYKTYFNSIKAKSMLERHDDDLSFAYNDEIRVSAKVVLENTSFPDKTFGDMDCKFGDLHKNMSFGNIDSFLFNEIEWEVRYSSDQTDTELANIGESYTYEGDSDWYYDIRGDFSTVSKVLVNLPYNGYYDVKMTLYDSYNNMSTELKRKYIKVIPQNIEIKGFYFDAREIPSEFKIEHSDDLVEFATYNIKNMMGWATQEHFQKTDDDASMPVYQKSGEISHLSPYDKDKSFEILEAEHITTDITKLKRKFQDARYISNGVDVKPYTWFLLGYDYSKISGKKNPVWKLTNTRTGKSVKHEGRYITYLLKDVGEYKIELELEDTNGNKYSIDRNIFVVEDISNYRLYTPFKKDYDRFVEEMTVEDVTRGLSGD